MGPLPSRIWRIIEKPARPGIPSRAALVSSNRPSGKPRRVRTGPRSGAGAPTRRREASHRQGFRIGIRNDGAPSGEAPDTERPRAEGRSWSAPDRGEAAQSRIRLRDGQDDLATPAKTDYAPPLAFAPAGG